MKFSPLWRLLSYATGLNFVILLAGTAVLGEALLNPVLAHLMRQLVDTFLGHQAALYTPLAIRVVLVMVLMSLVAWTRTKMMGRIAENCAAELRRRAAEKLLTIPVPKLDAIHTGDHLSRLTNDISVISTYLNTYAFWLFTLPVMAVVAMAYMTYINWQMIVATIVFLPLLLFLTARASAPIGTISKELQQNLAGVNNVTQDALGGAEVVKAYNLHKEMERRFDEEMDRTVVSGLQLAGRKALLRASSVMSGLFPFILPLGIGGYFTIQGIITIGDLLAYLLLLNSVTFPLSALPNVVGEHQRAMGALERVEEMINEPAERSHGQAFSPVPNGDVVLATQNLSFGYDEEQVLRNLSFEIRRGETVALVGASGSGKTTVFKLLTGFYPPDSGQVLLYGKPLEQWQLSAARREMALVAQDTFLFPGTVAENIALGRPQATREEIVDAARRANAHEFISKLPQGYDHVLTERGANLSGGQRQRMAIARAILVDTPILLLDEATSALDTESEYLVQQALEDMAATRTTLVIAHRLSTIRDATRILVLDQGRICESGTHQQLMEKGGLYRQLYFRQFSDNGQQGGDAS